MESLKHKSFQKSLSWPRPSLPHQLPAMTRWLAWSRWKLTSRRSRVAIRDSGREYRSATCLFPQLTAVLITQSWWCLPSGRKACRPAGPPAFRSWSKRSTSRLTTSGPAFPIGFEDRLETGLCQAAVRVRHRHDQLDRLVTPRRGGLIRSPAYAGAPCACETRSSLCFQRREGFPASCRPVPVWSA
jgi:hypothetical protein